MLKGLVLSLGLRELAGLGLGFQALDFGCLAYDDVPVPGCDVREAGRWSRECKEDFPVSPASATRWCRIKHPSLSTVYMLGGSCDVVGKAIRLLIAATSSCNYSLSPMIL